MLYWTPEAEQRMEPWMLKEQTVKCGSRLDVLHLFLAELAVGTCWCLPLHGVGWWPSETWYREQKRLGKSDMNYGKKVKKLLPNISKIDH